MPKALSDDLRCRIVGAYARGEGSQRELAVRFGVSFEYVRKVCKQWRCSGQMERAPQSRHGRMSRVTEAVREQLRVWVTEQPDRTLAELGEQLSSSGVSVSRSRVCQILQHLGLRLKKSRSTPVSVTQKPTASGAKSTLPPLPKSRQRS